MKGFSLVEIILAIALAAIFIPAISWALGLGLQSSSQGENFTKAQALAQEDMEKVYQRKSLNDGTSWDWAGNIPPEDSTEENTSGIFTRKITFAKRDPTISYSLARKVTVTVSWKENGVEQTNVELVSYITAH